MPSPPFYPRWDEELYRRLREELELPDRRVKELSKGQGKILSFIMAYATRPRLLILDEPTATWTRRCAHALMGCLRGTWRTGRTRCSFPHTSPRIWRACATIWSGWTGAG